MSINKIFLTGILCFATLFSNAQNYYNRVVAQVGDAIVLESDIQERYQQEASIYAYGTESDALCHLVYTTIAEKILANIARGDSLLMVSEARVEIAVEEQIETFLERTNNDVSKLEQLSGRSIGELRKDFKPIFDDMLHAENAQKHLVDAISITPKEVKQFYSQIPKDSLELIPATVEIGQIVIEPGVDTEIEDITKERLEQIRKEIVEEGKSFATLASLYSQDGSAQEGGLMTINRTGFDPHFVAAAYRLQPGEVSPVTKSQFGYHIIKMEARQGDLAKVRHIVMIPQPTSRDINAAKTKADSLKSELIAGKITFADAVAKYSTDMESKFTSGMIMNPNTGKTQIPLSTITQLDIIKDIGSMEVGTFTDPIEHVNERTGKLEIRLYYLKTKKEAHTLNLKDDYALIQEVALGEKRNEHLQEYINKESGKYFIKVAPDFKDCDLIKKLTISE